MPFVDFPKGEADEEVPCWICGGLCTRMKNENTGNSQSRAANFSNMNRSSSAKRAGSCRNTAETISERAMTRERQ